MHPFKRWAWKFGRSSGLMHWSRRFGENTTLRHEEEVPFMTNAKLYEEQILKEIKALPEEALPKVLRLLTLVREEFFAQERQELQKAPQETASHEKTQHLLAT